MLSGHCVAKDSRNGTYWAEINDYAKMGYIFGLIDGVFTGRYFGLKASEVCDKSYLHEMVKYLEGVSPKQVLEGMNSFYSEYTNRNIEIFNAFYLVLMNISGESEALINSFTQDLRKGDQFLNDEFGLSP
jgi:hypothetical protein